MKLKKEIKIVLYFVINLFTIIFLVNLKTNITDAFKLVTYIVFNLLTVIRLFLID